jgi:formylglycine-generating enzyme required for sulfatase activity
MRGKIWAIAALAAASRAIAAGVPEPEMVRVPGGTFQMGSVRGEPGREGDEAPRHTVRIARAFYVSKYEITGGQWNACVADKSCTPARRPLGDSYPVTDIRWKEAQGYIAWLNSRTGKKYRFLTEAEWEYAARAGTDTPWFTGSTVAPAQANFAASGLGKPTRVGQYAPNGFGLYDMAGNVWEWVADCFDELGYYGAPADGSARARADCQMHVLRGGGFDTRPGQMRSAYRYRAQFGGEAVGLRVALEENP